ncbi:MAG: hypothetical protein FJ095_04000 [Deltaproteobacteria bacterium]|nr:hypothetical protein [Deltaproteobacteria bacterium]
MGFVTAGLGAATLGAAVVTWTLAGERHDELLALCGAPPCTKPGVEAIVREGERLDLATNVALGLGIATTLAGATMIAVGWPSAATSRAALELRVAPSFVGLVGTL